MLNHIKQYYTTLSTKCSFCSKFDRYFELFSIIYNNKKFISFFHYLINPTIS